VSGTGIAATGLTSLSGSAAAAVGIGPEVAPFDLMAHQPMRVKSTNGVLRLILVAEYSTGKFKVNGVALNVRSFNGKLPGYTMVVRPGDVLKIRLENKLPASADDHAHPHDINTPHGLNNINLHVHGLNVSPEGREDNVLLTVYPKEAFEYEIHIPKDHPAGTFWYHPHKHGSSMHHMASGMAGFIIIEGGDGDLATLPELAKATTVNIAFQELILTPNGKLPNSLHPIEDMFKGLARLQYTVNGLAVDEGADGQKGVPGKPPVLRMRPGEVQRWRFGLLGHLQTYRFALQGHDIHIAAYDGITAAELVPHKEFIIGPGSRVDLLIKASDKPGVYPFKMLKEQFGEFPLFVTPNFSAAELPAFNVVVGGKPLPMLLPRALNSPQKRLPYITDKEITRRREIVFKVTGDVVFNWDTYAFVEDTRQFFINNQKFNANRINETVLLGTAEEWTIINIHEANNKALQINHPFHIHVNWILVMEVHHPNGKGGFTVEKLNHGRGTWMDNIDIPHGGKAVIRHRFQKFSGIFPLHCHVLAHEDEGMMHLVEVVDPAPVKVKITKATGGVLASKDLSKRVKVVFKPGNYSSTNEVSYYYNLYLKHLASKGLVGLERYFRIYSKIAMQGAATITVNFPLELSRGEVYDPQTVKLYRSSGTGWTTNGITQVTLDAKKGVLVSTVKTLGNGYFAVLATMISGSVTPTPGSSIGHVM
jgi:FtsP/CotA-like multicopper oxidase with cupredoxin domain